MPEAIAVFLVLMIVGGLLLAAWLHSRHAQPPHPHHEREQARQHLQWLEERLRHAEAHRWGDDMKQRLTEDIARTRKRLGSENTPDATRPDGTPGHGG